MQEKYTKKAFDVLQRAKEAAAKLGNEYIGTEHILLGLTLVQQSVAAKALEGQNVTYHQVMERICEMQGEKQKFYLPLDMTPRAKRVVERSKQEAVRLGANYVGTEHILLALLREPDTLAITLLEDLGVDIQTLYEDIMLLLGESEAQPAGVQGMHERPKEEISETETLDKFSRDMTALAKQGKFDPIVGREQEIERIIRILSRRTKNNPCLMGDPGVGKTAIVEGLAQKISDGNVPDTLRHKRILSLDLSAMVAGSKYRGEFEERMKKALEDVKAAGNIILFIDEIHTVIGAGAAEGAIDASNILKPALARGEIQLIGATTLEEYRKHIEKDAAFERRFQPVRVEEPTEAVAVQMLTALKDPYEMHHRVRISDEAIAAAVKLSARYVTERFLPDKAIDLIDEAASCLRLSAYTAPTSIKELEARIAELEQEKETAIKTEEFEQAAEIKKLQDGLRTSLKAAKRAWESTHDSGEIVVTADNVAEIVSRWTGIPVQSMQEEESQRLLHLEEVLHKRVIGQDEAVKALAKAVRRGRVGLKDPNRPIGSFLFLGPTGVGKTELSKALAEALFGDENAMVRIDMSEYMEKHSVSRMVGSPPGYVGYEEGGQLSEKVRRNPYSVVLFDEIEKASPEVFNILLQVLDDGHITDGQGRKVDFKNTVIIMTSNAGARSIAAPKRLGFTSVETPEQSYEMMKKGVMDEIKNIFKPEFLNRIDDIIVFHPLEKEEITRIVRLLTDVMAKRVKENMNITVSFTKKAIEKIAEEGYDKAYGARPLRRAIQSKIEDAFAEEYLLGNIKAGDKVSVGLKTNGFSFRVVK
ncbi:ATP-dependent Clp protease ATP-binding subunit [Anaerotignum faecicola]|uniref:ATP-dependent Clp protease ATP-binding subunit ClpC n=1 Tax=Anaerotignum faecicola TaxID=2358141 RepID=A0A401LEQ1_9FIRM|nr:ATP-dependent Clp protease ATP-binding subunit [Anaerotignum faecicola]GCB30018.1 ATP-dependent Clp protease ATP-binding subunit ClpC [Anaerotignum faecicola]